MRAAALLGLLLLADPVPVGPSAGRQTPKHENAKETAIPVNGRRILHRWRDLDGDGRRELIVASSIVRPFPAAFPTLPLDPVALREREYTSRSVQIVWNGPSGLDIRNRATIEIPRDGRCFAFASVLGSPGLDLVILDARGARAVALTPGAAETLGPKDFRRVASDTTFFDFTALDELPEWGLTLGKSAPGGPGIILPNPDGFRVWRAPLSAAPVQTPNPPRTNRLVRGEALAFHPVVEVESSSNRRFAVVKTLPRPILRDVDGDGLVDFVLGDLSGARQWIVYPGRANGSFSTEPVARPAPGLRRELKADQLTYETADALDLNGDGICDLVISRTEGNIGLWDTLTTSQLVFYGRRGPAGFDVRPDQVVSSAGVSMIPRAIDFDGDGQLDLLVSSYRTDLLSNARNAAFNSARISYFLFMMEGGKYPRNATVERNVDVDFKLIERGGVEPRAYFDGDFDGDGVKDLLAVESEDHVRAYRGVRRKASLLERAGFDFESRPMMDIRAKANNDLEVVDIHDNGTYAVVIPDASQIRVFSYQR